MLAVPFLLPLVGAIWYLYIPWLQRLSIAVWVGMIALMGLDAETGVFMLLFLDLSYNQALKEGKMKTEEDFERSDRSRSRQTCVRPKMMTVCAAFMGLIPIDALGWIGSRYDETRRRPDGRRSSQTRAFCSSYSSIRRFTRCAGKRSSIIIHRHRQPDKQQRIHRDSNVIGLRKNQQDGLQSHVYDGEENENEHSPDARGVIIHSPPFRQKPFEERPNHPHIHRQGEIAEGQRTP